jgi:hypothetical protein
MIDLKQLENEIDELLEQETTDSLLSWLYETKIRNLKLRLGEGVFDDIPVCEDHQEFIASTSIILANSNTASDDCSNIIGHTAYCTAA